MTTFQILISHLENVIECLQKLAHHVCQKRAVPEELALCFTGMQAGTLHQLQGSLPAL